MGALGRDWPVDSSISAEGRRASNGHIPRLVVFYHESSPSSAIGRWVGTDNVCKWGCVCASVGVYPHFTP